MIAPREAIARFQVQTLEDIRTSQAATVASVRAWTEVFSTITPELNYGYGLPFGDPDVFGDPKENIDANFAFARQVLELNRQFAREFLTITVGESAKPANGRTSPRESERQWVEATRQPAETVTQGVSLTSEAVGRATARSAEATRKAASEFADAGTQNAVDLTQATLDAGRLAAEAAGDLSRKTAEATADASKSVADASKKTAEATAEASKQTADATAEASKKAASSPTKSTTSSKTSTAKKTTSSTPRKSTT